LADPPNLFGLEFPRIAALVASWAFGSGFVHEMDGFGEYWCVEHAFRYAKSFS
jgi:hypothetical protein